MGCASTRTHEGTGEYVDDSAITSKVKAAIFTDPALKVFQINVETFKGEIHLITETNRASLQKQEQCEKKQRNSTGQEVEMN